MDTYRSRDTSSHRERRPVTGGGGGVVLIFAGLLALAWTQGLIRLDLRSILPNLDMERIWPGFNWGLAWPIFLLIPGILLLAGAALSTDPRQRVDKLRGGTVLVALSAFFFASMWGVLSVDLWPVLMVIGGGLMLLRPRTTGSAL
jgi:hypothetical protein